MYAWAHDTVMWHWPVDVLFSMAVNWPYNMIVHNGCQYQVKQQAPVFPKLDSAFHRINLYLVDKY